MDSPSPEESARVLSEESARVRKHLDQLMEEAGRLSRAAAQAGAEELAPTFVERRIAQRRQFNVGRGPDRRAQG
jgi:hypothetical protein